ncbi:MAG: hypothetical protein CML61_13015 [Rhodobacteraceae bacterium]|nr:hypothetical protein [Paracoccaceae bacterium]
MINAAILRPENFDPLTELWASVILRAVLDAHSTSEQRDERQARRQARIWLEGRTEDFRMVCALAGLDPDFIRDGWASGRITPERLTLKGRRMEYAA